MSTKIRGSCLCGAVRFQVEPPFIRAGHCHCERCRKHSGTAVCTQARVRKEQFQLLQGRDLIRVYGRGEGAVKAFCRNCGSSLFGGDWPDGPEVSIRMGAFDDDPGIKPQFHTFVNDRAPWDSITDDLPQYADRWKRSGETGLVAVVSGRCKKNRGSIGHRIGLCYCGRVKSIGHGAAILAIGFGLGACASTSNLMAKTGPAGTGFNQNGKITLHRGEPCTSQIMFDFHPASSKAVIWLAAGAHDSTKLTDAAREHRRVRINGVWRRGRHTGCAYVDVKKVAVEKGGWLTNLLNPPSGH